MPRFYFHMKYGGKLITDDDGVDLPGLPQAQREALQDARELLAHAIRDGKPRVPEAFVITDEAGKTLVELPLIQLLPEPLKK